MKSTTRVSGDEILNPTTADTPHEGETPATAAAAVALLGDPDVGVCDMNGYCA